jgi:hypothetical protein
MNVMRSSAAVNANSASVSGRAEAREREDATRRCASTSG